MSGVAKLGDFGLSCKSALAAYDEDEEWGSEEEEDKFEEHTRGVGTGIYTAPELAKNCKYDEKVDMYSLGIVFFELLYPFSTRSERCYVLQSLRGALQMPAVALVSSLLCSPSLAGDGTVPALGSPLVNSPSPRAALTSHSSLSCASTALGTPRRSSVDVSNGSSNGSNSDGALKKWTDGVAQTAVAQGGVLGTGLFASLSLVSCLYFAACVCLYYVCVIQMHLILARLALAWDHVTH